MHKLYDVAVLHEVTPLKVECLNILLFFVFDLAFELLQLLNVIVAVFLHGG